MPKRPDPDYQSSNAEPPLPTPLAIILSTMHLKYQAGDLDGAVALARIAAPYIHPRVPAAAPPAELPDMPDADLDAFQAPD